MANNKSKKATKIQRNPAFKTKTLQTAIKVAIPNNIKIAIVNKMEEDFAIFL